MGTGHRNGYYGNRNRDVDEMYLCCCCCTWLRGYPMVGSVVGWLGDLGALGFWSGGTKYYTSYLFYFAIDK